MRYGRDSGDGFELLSKVTGLMELKEIGGTVQSRSFSLCLGLQPKG
jgi:hypothetical protein